MLMPFRRMRGLSSPSGLGRVIVADPDESAYAMVRQLTAPDRWEVRYVGTSEELREALRSGPAQLALVNLSLLDEELSEELSEELMERSRRGLRVVIVADEHNELNERRARVLSPVFYAPKPVQMGVLNEVVQGALKIAV